MHETYNSKILVFIRSVWVYCSDVDRVAGVPRHLLRLFRREPKSAATSRHRRPHRIFAVFAHFTPFFLTWVHTPITEEVTAVHDICEIHHGKMGPLRGARQLSNILRIQIPKVISLCEYRLMSFDLRILLAHVLPGTNHRNQDRTSRWSNCANAHGG